MENLTTNSTISRVEAVVCSMDENTIELQIAGSYETIKWPSSSMNVKISVGEKILIELKNLPSTSIQKMVDASKQNQPGKDPIQQRKLLESLIN